MRVLLANLRQFRQRRSLVLDYGIVGVITFVVIYNALLDAGARRGAFAWLLVPVLVLGTVVAIMQMEVLTKPFSFCLPGHRAVVRRLILAVGFAASFFFSLPFVCYPGLFDASPARAGLVLCSAFAANLMAYMLGVGVGVTARNAMALLGFLPFIVLLGPKVGLNVGVEHAIVHSPVVIIALTVGTAIGGWVWLGRASWFRRHSGAPRVGLCDAWDRSKMGKYREVFASRRFACTHHTGIDRFFLGRIGSQSQAGAWKYAWGALYQTSLVVAPQWKGLLFVVLLALLVGGYLPGAALVIAVIPAMMAGYAQPPVHSALLVAGGRTERFRATITVLLVLTAAAFLVVSLVVVLSNVLAHIMPEIAAGQERWTFDVIDSTALLLPVLIVPVVGLLQIVFNRKPVLHAVSFMLVFTFIMVVSLLGRISLSGPPLYAVGCVGAVLAWVVCLLVVRHVTLHRDLT